MAWSPQGAQLAAGTHHHYVLLWDDHGLPRPTLFEESGNDPSTIAWLPDDERLILGSSSRSYVALTNIAGAPFKSLVLHPDATAAQYAASLAGGSKRAAASRSGIVRMWNARSLKSEWLCFQSEPYDFTFFDDSGPISPVSSALLKNFLYLVERPGGRVDVLPMARFPKIADAQ